MIFRARKTVFRCTSVHLGNRAREKADVHVINSGTVERPFLCTTPFLSIILF